MTSYKKEQVKAFVLDFVREFRWGSFIATIILAMISFFFVYSATFRTGSEIQAIPSMVKQQIFWFCAGLVLYLVVALTDYEWICEKSWIFFVIVAFLLLCVAIFPHIGLGKFTPDIYGARRWLKVGGYSIQPSEFAKLACLLTVSYFLFRQLRNMDSWRPIVLTGMITVMPLLLTIKEDLGTAMVLVFLIFTLLFLAGANVRYLALIILVGLNIAVYSYQFPALKLLKPYQKHRIDVFLNPDADPLGAGWNLTQSRIAVGSGRTWGKGFLKGEVKGLGYLPRTVAHNDFIFSVYAEETGFVGGIILLGLYSIILIGAVRVALFARDSLGRFLALGVAATIFFHVFVNVGMTMGIMPITGVPLPLVSYGGSFMLIVMVCLGLVQSVWLHRKPY
jgi:rod shape determining protein RodA